MKIPYFCCIGAELKRYEKDFDFMNQVYLYKVPTDDTMEEVLAQDYFQPVADTVLQDDIVYIYEPTTEMLYTCRFNKQNGHITAIQMSNNIPELTPNRVLISDATGHITAGDVTLEYLKNKLNLDGTSTMTGPLKMRASVSFECAVAPYWHGVGLYKLNDNDSVTLLASMEATDGFEPGTNNTYNIGSTSKKWKNLYLAGKAFMSTINNGFDIAVPVTNSADTFALKSQVDDAANSGEQLYTTGVWFAKMYSASVVPTGAEYDGKNYADFSQVDNDNNPIVVIYEGQSGSWVEIARITPPANHVAYLTITSKIWDIAEQTDQQGGEVLWSYNQKTFTPYPKIVSTADLANTDLSNLTPTGEAKFVHSTGNEDVAGEKTFTDKPIIEKATGATLDFVDTNDLTSADGGCTVNAYQNTSTRIGHIDFYRRGTSSANETHTYAGTADLAVIKPDNADGYIGGSADILSSLAHMAMPNYTAGIASTTGTAATNGFLYAKNQGSSGSPDAILTLKSGSTTIFTIHLVWFESIMIPVPKGISWAITGGYSPYACLYPCYGG